MGKTMDIGAMMTGKCFTLTLHRGDYGPFYVTQIYADSEEESISTYLFMKETDYFPKHDAYQLKENIEIVNEGELQND